MNAPSGIDIGTLMPGCHWPLGATVETGDAAGRVPGINFAVWAPQAEALELCVFDAGGHHELRRLAFPACRDGVWHGRLQGAGAGLVVGSLKPLGVMIQGATGAHGVIPTNEAIAGIAQDGGWSDQSSLTRAMRRIAGCTPASYRRR